MHYKNSKIGKLPTYLSTCIGEFKHILNWHTAKYTSNGTRAFHLYQCLYKLSYINTCMSRGQPVSWIDGKVHDIGC